MMEYFDRCKELFQLIKNNNYLKARNGVIQLLHEFDEKKIKKNELINHLIREVGLFQYIDGRLPCFSDQLKVLN